MILNSELKGLKRSCLKVFEVMDSQGVFEAPIPLGKKKKKFLIPWEVKLQTGLL